MNKTVAFTVYNRPWYLAQTLNTWEHVRDAEQWTFNFHVEPSQYAHEVLNIITNFRSWMGVDGVTVSNPRVKGCASNSHDALENAFSNGAEFAVLAEDDAIVSSDILEWFEFMAETQADEDESVTVCASNTRLEDAEPHLYEYRAWFKPMVWGTWADRWEHVIKPTWDFDYSSGEPGGWDCNLGFRVIPSVGRSIMPLAARCKHIGLEGGVHFLPEHAPAEEVRSFKQERPRQTIWKHVGAGERPYLVR